MASYSVNERAVAHARQLIDARQYVLDSDWGESQPNAEDENAFLESHSWDEYAEWHLGLTDGRQRRDQGAVRVRLRRLPAGPPDRPDRLRVPRRRVAAQGGRARRARPAPAARQRKRVNVPAFAAWQHHDARVGFEVVFFDDRDDRINIEGHTAALEDGEPFAVRYAIELDRHWRTRSAQVSGQSSQGERSLQLEADGDGRWRVDGHAAPQLDGCLDVDLSPRR